MNAKQLLDAMNEIDDQYIRRAAPRRKSGSGAGRIVWGTVKWAGGIAAALALTAGLIFLGHLQTQPVPAAGAGGESAEIKEATTPLEDLPPLIFPTREDWEAWRAGDDHSIRIADYMEPGQTVDLVAADFNFASLWGEDRLFWENRDLEEEFEFGGFAVYGQDGSLWYVHLSGYPKDPAARYVSAPLFELYLSPGERPPELNPVPDFPERANDIWGTNVSTRYWETEKGDTIEDFHDYEASFFIVGDEPIGARITGYAMAGDSYYPDDEIVDLLTRFVSHSLRPGNTFTLAPLAEPPEDLPPLIFPTREDWEAWRAGDDHSIRTADYMEPGQTVDLVAADFNFASLWGEDRLFWENRDLEEEFEFGGFAVYGQDGSLWYVHLSGYPKDPAARYVSAPLFELYLSPGGKPPEFNEAPDLPERANDIWGTNVSTRYWETEKGDTIEDFHDYEASFFIVGNEPIGARITGYAVAGDSYYSDGEIVDLLTRFVSQCLRPGNTFTLAPLAEPPEVPAQIQEREKTAQAEAEAEAEAELAARRAQLEEERQTAAEEEMRNAAVETAADLVDEWLRGMNGQYPEELQECFFQDLRITHVAEDEESMILSLRLVFKPTDAVETNGWWWAGNTKEGTGENEGYLTAARQVLVNKIDGRWEFGGSFTGGMATEGFREAEISLGDQLTESKLLDLADKAQADTLTPEDFAPFAFFDRRPDFNALVYPVPQSLEITYAPGQTAVTAILHDQQGSAIPLSDGREAVEAFLGRN